MKLCELPYAKIILLRDDIAEVIINEGVEMDGGMVDDYHEFLLTNLTSPFSLLINKINSYAYDFEAQKKLATLDQINAMAVVAYSRSTKIATQTLISFPRDHEWNLKLFDDRTEALNWLLLQQDKIKE